MPATRIVLAIVCIASFLTSPAYAAEGKVELVNSSELHVSKIALLCGDQARQMVSVHRSRKAPLEPFGRLPAEDTRALLGLVVQVRGKAYVRKDLTFDLAINIGQAQRIYHGVLKGIDASRADKAAAVTTDWWIDLERLFTQADIASMCLQPAPIPVQVKKYSFSE